MDKNKNWTSLADKESQKTSVSINPMVRNVLPILQSYIQVHLGKRLGS